MEKKLALNSHTVNLGLAVVAIFLALAFAWLAQDALLTGMREDKNGGRLEKDALQFYQQATQPHSFYAASIREPFFPFIIKCWLWLWGSTDQMLVRTLTGLIGLGLVVLVATLGWKLAGPWCGVVCAWMYASSALVAYYSVSALRESTMGFLVVLLTLLLLCKSSWPQRCGLILVSAALPLMRLDSLVVEFLVFGGWVAWRWSRQAAVESIVYIAAGWLAVAPFLIACHREYGQAFHTSNVHATYWRNHEFADRPGFLTRDQVMSDAYSGEPTTAFRYIFGLHSIPEVIGRYIHGYWISLMVHMRMIFSWLDTGNPFVWFWILGLFWACRYWRTQGLIPLVALAAQFPFAFIVPVNTVMPGRYHAGVEVRFSLPMAPFVATLVGIGVVETVKWLKAKWWA